MTNDPALATRTAVLGGTSFKIVDLPYDDYLVFLSLLQPMLKAMANKLGGPAATLAGAEEALSAEDLLKTCIGVLPDLAQLVLRQTEPHITVADVKNLAGNPFVLANIVLQQIEQNRIIQDVVSFFVQMLPLMRMGQSSLMPQAK